LLIDKKEEKGGGETIPSIDISAAGHGIQAHGRILCKNQLVTPYLLTEVQKQQGGNHEQNHAKTGG
jgi:hypothetical protein